MAQGGVYPRTISPEPNFFLEHLWVDNHLRPIVYIYIIPYYQSTCLCKMLQNRQ